MKNKEMKIDEVLSHNNAIDTTEDFKKTPSKKPRQVGESSIDLYAVQCGECHKWRVISSQEEYEDIRSKIIEEPFLCSRKPGVSCEDPADIKYDTTRTWVLDKPNLPKTPRGFRRSFVLRKDYSKMDVYYISPQGKKFRTRNEVAAFVKAHPEYADVPLESFYFTTPKIMEKTIPANILAARKRALSSGVSASGRRLKKSSASPLPLDLPLVNDPPDNSPSSEC